MTKEIKTRIEQIQNSQVPDGYKKTKLGIVPSEWKEYSIASCLEKTGKVVKVEKDKDYVQIGIRSHGKGIFHKDPKTGMQLGNKKVYWIEQDCLIFNVVFAWEQAVAITSENEVGKIGSYRFPMYLQKKNISCNEYLLKFFMSKRGKTILEDASPGGAGRNKTLGQDRFEKSKLHLPSLPEQEKIADILTTQDTIIELKEKRIVEKEKQKKYLMQNLLTGKKRLAGFSGEWKKIELGAIFEYIQPTKYLVSSTQYDDSYEIPVLTAGKTFILGYTNEKEGVFEDVPVVIFDDFTTANKYVDFPFKAKSSAMKILKCKDSFNIKIVFESIQQINYPIGGHERHWISKYSEIPILLPPLQEQNAIAEILSTADKEIELLKKDLDAEKEKKKSLMQLLLTGIIRVES